MRSFSQIFADVRFSWEFIAFRRRRFLQKTAGNRTFSQQTADFCRNRFVPLSLSLLIPPYIEQAEVIVPVNTAIGYAFQSMIWGIKLPLPPPKGKGVCAAGPG